MDPSTKTFDDSVEKRLSRNSTYLVIVGLSIGSIEPLVITSTNFLFFNKKVAVDGSPESFCAAEVALKWAKSQDHIIVCNVVDSVSNWSAPSKYTSSAQLNVKNLQKSKHLPPLSASGLLFKDTKSLEKINAEKLEVCLAS
jgi:hypothetical protein